MTILITGGTGLVGTALSQILVSQQHRVIVLSRSEQAAHNGLEYAKWDVDAQTIDRKAIGAADVIIHLAGTNIAEKRWTKKRKKEIRDSRVQSCALLVHALKTYPNKVHTVVSASAIGWYGRDQQKKPEPFAESQEAAVGFLGETCTLWEAAITQVRSLGKRLVIVRCGIVLSKEGGALPEFRKPLRFGIAPIIGSGKQVISWIHIDDVCRLYLEGVNNPNLDGVYNAVAPVPCSNRKLTMELSKKIRGESFLPIHVPAFVLQLILGGMSIELLKSTTVSSKKIQLTGFQFQFPTIESALRNLV